MTARPAYQLEPDGLCTGIWARGHVTPTELLRICAWKSAKGLGWLSLNDEEVIEERTGAACSELRWLENGDVFDDSMNWDRWTESVRCAIGSEKKGTGLLGLSGVRYPVASAVLCILNPRAFPVLDQWAIAGLYGGVRKQAHRFCAADYSQYAQDLVGARSIFPQARTVHELDQAFMNAAMGRSSVGHSGRVTIRGECGA